MYIDIFIYVFKLAHNFFSFSLEKLFCDQIEKSETDKTENQTKQKI